MRFARVVVLMLALAPSCLLAGVIDVPDDQPTIQQAIFAASFGDTVLVSPGTYTSELDTRLDLGGRTIVLRSSEGPGETTIDPGGASPVLTLLSDQDSTCVIEGFTFRNGGSDDAVINCQNASPIIRNCVFESNTGRYGAIRLGESFEARIEQCVFRNNSGDSGGALSVYGALGRVTGCVFEGNTAELGGAVYLTFYAETRFDSCAFISNAADDGGAVYSMNSESRFERCTFWGNEADRGAAVYLNESYNPPEFHECSLVANDGGAFYSLMADADVSNSVIAFDTSGPALTCLLGLPSFTHCYIFGNAAGDSLSGFGADNRFVDPLICGIGTGDLFLCADSECVVCPENPWGEHVGALGVGCPTCSSAVEPLSWGRLKALFREDQR
jgi:hypothetical protein